MSEETKAVLARTTLTLRWVVSILVGLSLAVYVSCGGGGGGNNVSPSPPTITSVSVSCNPTSVETGQTSQCTATVTGTGSYSSAVTWSASAGTIDANGKFTAPATAGSVTVTAQSTEDTTKSGTTTVTVTVPVTITSVSVVCSPSTILMNQTSTCAATVQGTGAYNSAVTWTATDGTITASGVFTPASSGTATITATSTQDTTKSGTAQISVTNGQTSNQWTWMSGADKGGQWGIYGTLGVPAAANVPGGREFAVSWIDGSGNLWLFGGAGLGSAGNGGYLNDLWEFNPTSQTWTWMSGSSTADATGVYGAQGVAAAANLPGARYGAVSWIDGSGNLWLFGGDGLDSVGATGYLNDLWEFNPKSKTWTWMSGSSTGGATGVYGTQGVPAAANVPGAKIWSVSWIDGSGNLWLFGGQGYDSAGNEGFLNDLWEFNPKGKTWTWMSGGDAGSQPGIYGTQGAPAAANVPGSRSSAVSWIDGSGNFWLFGGHGVDSNWNGGVLNDLWKFNPTSNMWTWVSGSSTEGARGVYGTQGVPAAANVPGARMWTVSWIDGSGNLWLFGGRILVSAGNVEWLNDLWEFNPTSKTWTWMSGSSTGGATGVYGTQGVPAAANVPGAREAAVSWIDGSGKLWLFGGNGYDSTGNLGLLNDLWCYQP